MRRFIYQLVDRLADADSGLSRNRHYTLFATPSGARALRLHRRLSGLRNELEEHRDSALLSVARHEAGVEVRLEIPPLKLVRVSLLSDDDVAVLLRHDGLLPEALRRLAKETARKTPSHGSSGEEAPDGQTATATLRLARS